MRQMGRVSAKLIGLYFITPNASNSFGRTDARSQLDFSARNNYWLSGYLVTDIKLMGLTGLLEEQIVTTQSIYVSC